MTDMRKLINIVEDPNATVGTIPASGTTSPVTASKQPIPPAKGSAARAQDAAQAQSALPGGKEDPNAVELDKDNGLDKGTLDAIKKAGVDIKIKEADINSRDDLVLRDILNTNQESWNNFKEGNDITDNDDFYQQLVSHFISTDQLTQEEVDNGIAVERITGWLDTLADNVEVVEMNDDDFEKYGDEADRDVEASDGERKNADKNVIMQVRRAADNNEKPTKIFVVDGEGKLDSQTAKKILYAFDNIRPQAKGQFQSMLQKMSGFNDIIKMVDGKTIPEATSTVDEVAPLPTEKQKATTQRIKDRIKAKDKASVANARGREISTSGNINEGTMVNDTESDAFLAFLKSGPLAVGPDAYDDANSEEEMMQLAKLGAEEKIGNFFFDDELWDNISELRDNEGDNADAMPLVRARVAELFDVSVEESVVETPRTALDVAQEIRQKELELQKLYKKGTVKDLKGAKDLMNRTKALDRINIGESSPYREEDGASIEDISSAIQHRMFIGGTMEEALSAGKGPDEIMQQIEDVAEFHEGAEELGSSDISGMVNQVLMQLGVSRTEAYVDDTALDSIYENADPFARTKLTYEDVTRELEEGNEADVDMAHELLFQGDNDADLYRQQFLPIIKNLMRKRAKGIYEPEKAVKLWRYWVDNIVKKHAKELGIVNTRQISGATRNLAAKMKSEEQFDEMELGNWDDNKSAGTAESTEQQVVEAEGYSSLEDVYPAGPTEIWYWKEGNGRDFMMGVKWLAGRGVEVTKDSLASTHVKIGSIAETDPEKVYAMMQGENWSPQGEARDIIGKSGTGHTSMSVGDALVIGGKIQMVDRFGFVNPEDPKEVQMAESSKYSAEKTAALITDRIFEEMKNAK